MRFSNQPIDSSNLSNVLSDQTRLLDTFVNIKIEHESG